MASPLRPSLLPQCSSCARRVANLGLERWRPTYQQTRSKKTSSKQPDHIAVRLLKDVKSFGRAGALVPVTAGQMRNMWFPRGIADYVTAPQLKELQARNVAVERDFLFGVELTKKKKAEAAEEEAQEASRQSVRAEVELLSPQRSTELLATLLPPTLEFYRTPITPDTPPSTTASASPPLASTASANIYGSVSTADIAHAIRAILGTNEEAARVVVTDGDIRFVSASVGPGLIEGEAMYRVKQLGEYEVEISVKGTSEGLRRTVRVLPSEPVR
ncbi:hypothetical protein H2201_001837 [Coniosporium apollinis]|uniref:Ribosomal protein L9 domain-containing protein n=1 Tax=Coniosporium apollinis TaxID=61459 RepID=A0ABQ9P3X9_9PEZI|nr:hypothetical protein H2201_001837 [Coniosporium apollinis]